MQQLRKVLTQTTWANTSDAINKNSDRIYEAISHLENATTRNKGYYKTLDLLLSQEVAPRLGDIAFVYNSSNGQDEPYDVYEAALDTNTNTYVWVDSGINAPFANVDINDVNEAIDNTQQQIDALKEPKTPLICDSGGRLGLSIGNGLYVGANGELCATATSGGGGSGGDYKSYVQGDGISINGNIIQARAGASIDIASGYIEVKTLSRPNNTGLKRNNQGVLSVDLYAGNSFTPSDGSGYSGLGFDSIQGGFGIRLGANSGLLTNYDGLKLNIKDNGGLDVSSEGLGVNIASDNTDYFYDDGFKGHYSGLAVDKYTNVLHIKLSTSVDGGDSGLDLTQAGLKVKLGNGLKLDEQGCICVDVAAIINKD